MEVIGEQVEGKKEKRRTEMAQKEDGGGGERERNKELKGKLSKVMSPRG